MEGFRNITPLQSIKSEKLQKLIFKTFKNLVNKNLFTKEMYLDFKDYFVGIGESIETHTQKQIDAGKLKWYQEKLVNDLSTVEIILNDNDEEMLRQKTIKTGVKPCEIIKDILHYALNSEI